MASLACHTFRRVPRLSSPLERGARVKTSVLGLRSMLPGRGVGWGWGEPLTSPPSPTRLLYLVRPATQPHTRRAGHYDEFNPQMEFSCLGSVSGGPRVRVSLSPPCTPSPVSAPHCVPCTYIIIVVVVVKDQNEAGAEAGPGPGPPSFFGVHSL